MAPLSVLTPGFAKLFAGFLLCTLSVNLLSLTPYYLELRGAGELLYGTAAGMHGLAGVAAVALLGGQADRLSRRGASLRYFALSILGNLLALLAMNWHPASYLLPLALQGAAFGVGLPVLFVWASELCPPERRTEAFAWFGIAGLVGDSLGPLLAEMLLAAQARPNTPGAFFAVFVAANVLCPLGLACFARVPNVIPAASTAEDHEGLMGLLRSPCLRASLLATMAFGGALGVMLSLGKNFVAGIGLQFVSVLLAGHTVGALTSRVLLPWILARAERPRLITGAFAGVVTSMLLLSATRGYALLALSGLVYGVSHGVLFPTLLSRVIDFSAESAAGRVTSLYMGVFGMGFGLMPILGGAVLKVAGFPSLFRLIALCCAGGLLLARLAERLRAQETAMLSGPVLD
ncbi:MAG: MFS transporter [Myxococcales bacterium]|nr:MFS transporter [Myxococcales bacterium]MDD9972033.1 MFS transporter [Myxococcales bacterium]